MWPHNPPRTHAHLMDMFVGYYAYSGEAEAVKVMREMLDYQLAHGSTPEDWNWAGVPFPTSCIGDKEYGHYLQDVRRDSYGGIETDKIGELGLSYLQFYESRGERKYLEAGIRCGEQLAKNIRPGDATHTPWAFRIDARTGAVIGGEEVGGIGGRRLRGSFAPHGSDPGGLEGPLGFSALQACLCPGGTCR